LNSQNFYHTLEEINSNTASLSKFIKRFYLWFDGLKVVHYLNYSHEKYFTRVPVSQAAVKYMNIKGIPYSACNANELLNILRCMDGTTCE
jgi:hypothetical protein